MQISSVQKQAKEKETPSLRIRRRNDEKEEIKRRNILHSAFSSSAQARP
jgi:hypothetical protein